MTLVRPPIVSTDVPAVHHRYMLAIVLAPSAPSRPLRIMKTLLGLRRPVVEDADDNNREGRRRDRARARGQGDPGWQHVCLADDVHAVNVHE